MVVAVDLPSGLDADSGAVDEACLFVDVTITLGYPKVGLFNFPGAERVGKLIAADIGITPKLADGIRTELITADWVKSVLPKRPLSANKGTFGGVMVAAGSINYIGAAYLACAAASAVDDRGDACQVLTGRPDGRQELPQRVGQVREGHCGVRDRFRRAICRVVADPGVGLQPERALLPHQCDDPLPPIHTNPD
jgi:hypothetical protein